MKIQISGLTTAFPVTRGGPVASGYSTLEPSDADLMFMNETDHPTRHSLDEIDRPARAFVQQLDDLVSVVIRFCGVRGDDELARSEAMSHRSTSNPLHDEASRHSAICSHRSDNAQVYCLVLSSQSAKNQSLKIEEALPPGAGTAALVVEV